MKSWERIHRDVQACSDNLRKIKNTFVTIMIFQFLIMAAVAVFVLYVFGIIGG